MVEDLDHLLAGDHLLDIAVDGTQGLLLADEVTGGFGGQDLGHIDNEGHGKGHDDGQDPGGVNEVYEDHDQSHQGGNALGKALGQYLAKGIDVAGIAGHDVTGGMAVEIPQGQPLHLGEQIVPDGLLHALGDAYHQIIIEEGAQNAQAEHTGQLDEIAKQGRKVCGAALHHGQNIVVYQRTQRPAALGLGHGGQQNAHQHKDQGGGVFFQIAQQTQKGLLGVAGFAAVAAHSYRRH